MPPDALPPHLAGRAFTTTTAIIAGVPRQRLRAGDLASPFHGVRMPQRWVPSLQARCTAYAVSMPPEHAYSGPTAALLWGLPLPAAVERDPRLHVTALDNGRAPRGRLIAGHRTAKSVETRMIRGCRVVAPAEALIDLASHVGLDALIAAGDRLIGLPRPLADRRDIDAALRRHAGRRGVKALRAAIEEMRENVLSPRETRTRLLIMRAGFGCSEPEPNGCIELHHGGRTRGDLVFRREKVVVEYEGEQHLLDSVQWAVDLERYNALALSGWLVIRLSKDMGDDAILECVGKALVR